MNYILFKIQKPLVFYKWIKFIIIFKKVYMSTQILNMNDNNRKFNY